MDFDNLFAKYGEEFGFETKEEMEASIRERLEDEYINSGEYLTVQFDLSYTNITAKVVPQN